MPRTKIKKLTIEERKAIIKRRHKDQYDEENVVENDFLTTSQMFSSTGLVASPNRTNFKRKTAFSHYYNAFSANGVFFNPDTSAV